MEEGYLKKTNVELIRYEKANSSLSKCIYNLILLAIAKRKVIFYK